MLVIFGGIEGFEFAAEYRALLHGRAQHSGQREVD